MGSPYVVPVLATALLSVAAGAFVRARARHEPTTREFVIDCAALALTCAAYAAELASATLEAKVVWLGVRYVGICAIPLTSLRLALRWGGHDAWLAPKRFVPIAAIPAIRWCQGSVHASTSVTAGIAAMGTNRLGASHAS